MLGEASFSLFFQMFGNSIEKERGVGRVHRDGQKYHWRRRQPEGDTQRQASGRPHCRGLLTLRTADSRDPTGAPTPHRHGQRDTPQLPFIHHGETEAQGGRPESCAAPPCSVCRGAGGSTVLVTPSCPGPRWCCGGQGTPCTDPSSTGSPGLGGGGALGCVSSGSWEQQCPGLAHRTTLHL